MTDRFITAIAITAASATAIGAQPTALPAIASVSARRPNIVVILADDVGYGDLSCYGATRIKTPNLDRLAAQGLRCTDAYAAAAVCTPTRFSMLTGMWAWRQNDTGILAGDAPSCFHPGTVTLPQMMQQAGYATGVIGKWHLGLGSKDNPVDFNRAVKPGPCEIGFDESFVFPATNDRVPTVFLRNRHVVKQDPADPISVSYAHKVGHDPDGFSDPEKMLIPTRKNPDPHMGTIVNGVPRIGWMSGGKAARWDDTELSDTFDHEVNQFLKTHQKEPFFLYFAPHTCHEPNVPAKRFQGRSEIGTYGDALLELDWSVGRVMDALERQDLADNTIVIFSSDNGAGLYQNESYQYSEGGRDPLSHRRNGPLRGGKGDQWEGGTRVPFIVRWPGRIKPASQSAEIICLTDLPATCAAILGQAPPVGYARDSINILPALLGNGNGRDYVIQQHYRGHGNLAIRKGKWKLFPSQDGPQLYDLSNDPGETKNVAAQNPQVTTDLTSLLEQVRAGNTVSAKSDCDTFDPKKALLPQ